MAFLPDPALFLDVTKPAKGDPFPCNYPPDLVPCLPTIWQVKPDGDRIHYLETLDATIVSLMKNETRIENVHDADWRDDRIPVHDQEKHETCWSDAGSENISDACYYNGLSDEYIAYSGQYLVDFADNGKAAIRYKESNGDHYCYGFSAYRGLRYAMTHGIPRRDDWTGTGCGTEFLPNRNLGKVRLKHVLHGVKPFTDVNEALYFLKIQPILGSLAIFSPDFYTIKQKTYRGATLKKSKFVGWHSVSLRSIKIENGETIGYIKNTHGTKSGDEGYIKVSLDVMIYELKTIGLPSFGSPGRLFRSFVYGEVRPEHEAKVVECYIDGHKIDEQITRSKETAFYILEAIFHHTSGHVFQYEDGETEVIGIDIERAMLNWAIQLQLNMDMTYSKSGSMIIKRSPFNPQGKRTGIAVECLHETYKSGIRIHWKDKATFILGKCTKYDSNGECVEMSKTKRTELKDAIDDMVAKNLICIAFAYKEFDWRTNLSHGKRRQKWRLPCEDLILLAIFGIKVPFGFEECVQKDASLADLVDTAFCPSISEGLENCGDMERVMDEEIEYEEPTHDESVSAATRAVNLLSSTRLMLKLDNVYTESSAQYLVDNACPKKEAGQGETDHHCSKLTVKDVLKFALNEGIPREEDWPHLGCMFNRPSSSFKAARISIKGEVMKTVSVNKALELFTHQPVGAKLHVFSPDIDLLGDGIYIDLSCEKSCYVGLRNVIMYGATQMDGRIVVRAKMCYGNKVAFIKVSLEAASLQLLKDGCSEVNDGISKKGEDWPLLGSMFKPPSSYIPARISMKGKMIESENLAEALKFFKQQLIGARLHVFSLELDDHLGEEGIYVGPSSDGTRYVGLRDLMIGEVNKTVGERPIATVNCEDILQQEGDICRCGFGHYDSRTII